MIDIKIIRESADSVREACRLKNMKPEVVDRVLEIDTRRRALETEFNDLRHKQKTMGEQIAKAAPAEKAKMSAELGPLKNRLKEIEAEREQVDKDQYQAMLLVPQIPHKDAPRGRDDSENVEVRRHGTPRKREDFGFAFKDHIELGDALRLFDLDRGVKLAGARNYVLTGQGAMLHEAVLRLAWDLMCTRGFTPLTVPVLVLEKLMYGTGFFPLHRDEVYLAERDEQCLVGTAEVPVTGLHMDEILEERELPKLYVARSTCFRREAGAAGKDTRGLYRIHFFEKLEQVVICKADGDESARLHELIIKNSEDLLQALELPYRVVEVCTGDMGQGKVRMYDIETWMPSREKYSETHSASRFHDFQARRLNIRYRDADGKVQVCHTLNNTVVASPRILIPLMETNQNADGSITIPKALRPYMQNAEKISAGA
ncbi:MAG: serine--tRNA ligase [Phycisphaerae bacterium]|nr:serine--tRNA ligase [Phycisphaerae bacterium]